MSSDMKTLEELDLQIELFCSARAELLRQNGIEERYFIFNNRDTCVAEDAWVLSAKSDTDRELLEKIANSDTYPLEYRERIQNWLNDELLKQMDYYTGDDI